MFVLDVVPMDIRNVYTWKSFSIIYSALHASSRPLLSMRRFRTLNAEKHGATVVAQQIVRWRSRVTEAVGLSSTIGVAMGGAVVAVAGVAAGLAHGVVRGAAAGSNIPQLALPSMNDDQASTAYQSVGDSSEVPSAQAGRIRDGSGEERSNVSTTGRRPPRCHACWNPQIGNVRPLHHLYCGDCKLTPPITIAAATATAAAAAVAAFITANAATTTAEATNASATSAAADAAAAVFNARTEAAIATRLPESQGSLYGSVRSETEEGQLGRVKEEYRSTVGLSVGDTPLDRQRREGLASSTAPQLQLPPPLQPILQPQSSMTSEDRLAVLAGTMMDVRTELQAMRDDMRNIFRAAKNTFP